MSITYTPATNFGAKDSLPTNDPDKVIKGSEFTTEFTAIQTAFGLAAPAASPTFTGTVTIASVDINGGNIDGTTIGGTTPAAGTFSSLTATTVDINGGTIDGVTIGGSSAGAITGTTGQFNTSLNVDGTVTADGLTVNSGTTSSNISIRNSGTSFLNMYADTNGVAILDVDSGNTGAAPRFQIDVGETQVFRITEGGDISFYEDTGTTAKFFWDASAEALGIGTSSPSTKLHLGGTAPGDSIIRQDSTVSGTNWEIGERAAGKWQIWEDDGDSVVATFTSTGNVGIGESSVFDKLVVRASDDNSVQSALSLKNGDLGTTAGVALNFVVDDNNNVITSAIYGQRTASAYHQGSLQFLTRDSSGGGLLERMRIDSSGSVGIGKTSGGESQPAGSGYWFVPGNAGYFSHIQTVDTGNYMSYYNRIGTSSGGFFTFAVNDSNVGSVTSNGTTTSYNTSSDERLKENITDAEDASSLVDAIKVRQFDWKADGSHQDYGMIAQELLTVAPEAVSGDPESDDMMGVDYSKLVPMLVKEVQSLRARVAQLEGA